MKLEIYSLRNVDAAAAMQVLDTLFSTQGARVQISYEPRGNQLVAVARRENQAMIAATVEKLRGEERSLEIFQLEGNDVMTAQQAIDQLFAENGVIRGPNAPIVDVDAIGQQLFIRATKKQTADIRDLLVKMGESSLSESKPGNTSTMRTIPLSGDPAAVMSEVQRVWPQLRSNPIQLLTPLPTAPQTPRRPDSKAQGPRDSRGDPPQNTAIVPPPAPATGVTKTPTTPMPASPAAASAASPAPIFVSIVDGNIVIRSDDAAALDQFESLLRTVGQRGGTAGRNLSVFMLHNARGDLGGRHAHADLSHDSGGTPRRHGGRLDRRHSRRTT